MEGEETTQQSKFPLALPSPDNKDNSNTTCHIAVEIVSEEEMAFIEAALSLATAAAAASSIKAASSPGRSLKRLAIPFRPHQRPLSACSDAGFIGEIEDLGDAQKCEKKKKKEPVLESLFLKFRSKRGLSVTDITNSEWCEKQMEFILVHGKPKVNKAMKLGSARHLELEEEIIKRVEVRTHSIEEYWTMKFANFITGTNQLLFEGLTRELPIVGLVEGVWITGVIDEIRMPIAGSNQNPSLVDTKTRSKATLPSEAQKRNARLQLMCYKYLWDNMVADNFPLSDFYDSFGLNPDYILSQDIKVHISSLAFSAETFREFMMYFRNMCHLLPPSSEQLLLRYEFQGDNSLLDEYQFDYDASWLKNKILNCLKFWRGKREANCVSDDERWKCRFCSFAAKCPITKSNATQMAFLGESRG